MWDYYFDLLVLVLKRLPVKSLGRCKCVCISWNALISSSEFIQIHLDYQSSLQKKLYSIFSDGGEKLVEYSINCDADLGNLEVGCEIHPPYTPLSSMMVGSCRGLLCQIHFHKSDIRGEYQIFLCNQITNSEFYLPKNPMSLLKDEMKRKVAFYGFGYDDVHDTYKVFLASAPLVPAVPVYFYYRNYSQPDAEYAYEVYSLRSNSWTTVSSCHDCNDYNVHCPRTNLHGALINHALHWIIRNPYAKQDQNRKKNYILAFDLIGDQLDILVPLPEAIEENFDFYYQLILNVAIGCLLLTSHTIVGGPEDIVDMWVMKEYGLKDSWTWIRIHSSPYRLCSIIPVALLEEDSNHPHCKRKLIYHDTRYSYSYRSMLLSYDIQSHQVVELPPPPQPSSTLSALCCSDPIPLQYVGSLVQPYPPSGLLE